MDMTDSDKCVCGSIPDFVYTPLLDFALGEYRFNGAWKPGQAVHLDANGYVNGFLHDLTSLRTWKWMPSMKITAYTLSRGRCCPAFTTAATWASVPRLIVLSDTDRA